MATTMKMESKKKLMAGNSSNVGNGIGTIGLTLPQEDFPLKVQQTITPKEILQMATEVPVETGLD